MPESSQDAPSSAPPEAGADDDPMAAFGANEWLVDEMYERYQQDPESVDPAWWDFFKTYSPDGSPAG
ncbi:MAG: 2-oxoglutarate dehydrogenase E1 subunit family protein, partial [Nocardioidaceae bacterium]